jgi:hypothetical protein
MRRTAVVIAVFLLAATSAAFAATRADFDRVVDFSVTLKTLAAAAEGSQPLPTGRMIVLTGTVSSVTIVNKDQPTFQVRIELITGEWFGTEDVKAYTCFVDFTGAEFFKVFPARAPSQPSGSDVVLQNSRVLVAGRALSIVTTPLGEKRVIVEGASIRVIE